MNPGSHSGTSGSHSQYVRAKRMTSESCASMRQAERNCSCQHAASRWEMNRMRLAKEESITEQKAILTTASCQYNVTGTCIQFFKRLRDKMMKHEDAMKGRLKILGNK